MWNNIPGFWNSGRCGTALLRAAVQHTPHSPSLACNADTSRFEFRTKEQYFNSSCFQSNLLKSHKISLSGKKKKKIIVLSPGHRTAAAWFLLEGMPINNVPWKRPYYYYYYLLDYSRHPENSCIQFCEHEPFGQCLLFDICLVLAGWFMNCVYLYRIFIECALLSPACCVGQSAYLSTLQLEDRKLYNRRISEGLLCSVVVPECLFYSVHRDCRGVVLLKCAVVRNLYYYIL